MKLIQFIVFFQLLLIGIVIGLDQNNNSTQVDNGRSSQNNNTDNNQKNEDGNKNNNNDKDKTDNNKKNEDSKDSNNNEKEPSSKDNNESDNKEDNKDDNKSNENKDSEKDKDMPNDDENNSTKKNNSTNSGKVTDKDKQGISIQLLKPERLEAVQGILFAIGDTVEFEWKWAKDKKPKKTPSGFNLLAVRYVKGNIARYPIATNLSSSTFTFTLDPKSKNVTDLYDSMPEANDYLLYIYDSVNGPNYLGTNGTFHPFNIRMKLYRSKTPRAFSFNNANLQSSLSFTLPIIGLLTTLHILL